MQFHRHHPALSAVLGLVLLSLFIITPDPGQAAARWRTTWFEVVVSEPSEYRENWETSGKISEDISHRLNRRNYDLNELALLASFLHDVAVEYQHLGFADPTGSGHLRPLFTDSDGRERIRVYMYDIAGSKAPSAYYYYECPDPNDRKYRVLVLNTAKSFENGKLTQAAYQTAAHELFHAVQAASVYEAVGEPAKCDIGDWISEGTADAIAYYVTRKIKRFAFRNSNSIRRSSKQFFKLWGLRPYFKTLSKNVEDANDGYYTSSFWRHLAEINFQKKKFGHRGHQGSRKERVDYSYLVDLFSRRLNGAGAFMQEAAWLDKWMRGYKFVTKGLGPVHAQFAASIADHMRTRIPTIGGLPGGDRENKLLWRLFGNYCKAGTVSKDLPTAKIEKIGVQPLGAVCIRVRIKGPAEQVDLTIQPMATTSAVIKQLRIGAIGGELVGEPHMAKEGKALGVWHFPANAGMEHIFVLSNVANKVAETEPANFDLHVSIADSGSNLTEKSPIPPGDGVRQPKTREDLKKQAQKRAGKKSTTARVSRSEMGQDNCSAEARQVNYCGLAIEVAVLRSVLPPVAQFVMTPGMVGGRGGLFGQMGGLQAAQPGGPQTNLQSIQGNYSIGDLVSISFPLIPYGTSTGFGNALIQMGPYVSVTLPANNAKSVPNGNVTIEEYSLHYIKGFYSGILRDLRGYPPTVRELKVEGHFAIPAPWATDPAFMDQRAMKRGAANNIVEMLLNLPESARSNALSQPGIFKKLCDLGVSESQLQQLGYQERSCTPSVGIVGVKSFQCSCECVDFTEERKRPDCKKICQKNWTKEQCYPPGEEILRTDDEEVNRFMAAVRALGLSQTRNRIYHLTFQDAAPPVRAKLWQDVRRQQRPPARKASRQPAAQDAETEKYLAELRKKKVPPSVLEMLGGMFQKSKRGGRDRLWKNLDNIPQG